MAKRTPSRATSNPRSAIVRGRVVTRSGAPARAVTVTVSGRRLGRDEPLGEGLTDDAGRYEIAYARGKAGNLLLRAFDAEGAPLGSSKLRFDAPLQATIDLTLEVPARAEPSEHELLSAAVRRELRAAAVEPEDLVEEDVAVLERALHGSPHAGRLRAFLEDARLARETGLPGGFLYALARAGGGSGSAPVEALLSSPAEAVQALRRAIDRKLVAPSLWDRRHEIVARIERLREDRGRSIRRLLTARLVPAAGGPPLAGARVRVLQYQAGLEDSLDLGSLVTDAQGRFSLPYLARIAETGVSPAALRIEVLDRDGRTIHGQDLSADSTPIEAIVSLPAGSLPEPPSSLGIEALARELRLPLPPDLLRFLGRHHVRTLEDVRRSGGIGALDGLPVPADHPIVAILEGHARLSVLPLATSIVHTLVERGFTHVHQIDALTRLEFQERLRGGLGALAAARIHSAGIAASRAIDNILIGDAVETGSTSAAVGDGDSDAGECRCEDCEAMVSPGAYLADLIEYTLQHVRRAGARLRLDSLSDEVLHQPLGELPVTCASADEPVRQVRLAIEVLRRYLARRRRPAPDERAHRERVYLALLEGIGTSHEEMRRARAATEEARQRLAERLGISERHLDELLLDVATSIDEADLQDLFGFPSTTAEPASPATPRLRTWRLDRLRQDWETQDWPGNEPGQGAPLVDPDVITVGHCASARPARLWGERRAAIESTKADLIASAAAVRTVAQLDLWLGEGLGVAVTELLELERQSEGGTEIGARVEAMWLDRAALSRVLALRRIVESGSVLTSGEWEDAASILVQSWKRRQFSEWRRQEFETAPGDARLTLSPDWFELPASEPVSFPPPEPAPLPAWRATWRQRRDWESVLAARREQRQTVVAALEEVVAATEESALPALRDALVLATDLAGDDLTEKARQASEALFLDAAADGCQMTTRVGQSIESLQGLVWSLRTGQQHDRHPDLSLEAPDFDEEWKWIGSYATWRAAMFVFAYPENVLVPSLRRRSTPAFIKLVTELRSPRPVTPAAACAAARRYGEYFRDVTDLTLEATCHAPTRLSAGEDCRRHATPVTRDRYYMFGRGGETGAVYWSARALDGADSQGQSFWEPVPGLEGIEVVSVSGAAPYDVGPDESSVYLFVRAREKDEPKLLLTRYDLLRGVWDAAPTELELPEGSDLEAAVVTQTELRGDPPRLVLHCGPDLFVRSLDRRGVEWETGESLGSSATDDGDEWSPFKLSRLVPRVKELHASVRIAPSYAGPLGVSGDWLFFTDPAGRLKASTVVLLAIAARRYEVDLGRSGWVGALAGAAPGEVFVVHRPGTLGSVSRRIAYEAPSTDQPFVANLERLARHCGPMLDQWVDLVGSVTSGWLTEEGLLARTERLQLTFGRERGRLEEAGFPRRQVAPVIAPASATPTLPSSDYFADMDSLYDVSSGLDTAERQRRRELMRWAFGLNEESVRPYLEEAFYLVAVHLALQLQRQGQFLAALDWLRTVYDYSVEPDQRKIYFGLAQEESLAAGYERSADWLLDPLDPHRVAATRRNAHTRFTLLTLARCLLDYADAEFTRDTAESVPRARVLYTTALEILGRPELPVRPVDCDALIGALEIEVDGLAAEWIPAWREVKSELRAIHDRPRVERVVEQVRTILRGSSPAAERIAAIRQVAAHARGTGAVPRYAGLLSEADVWRRDQERAVLARPEAATAVEEVGRAAEERFVRDLVASVPSLREEHGGRDPVPIDLELAAGALDGLRETGGYRPPGFRPVFVPRAARVYSFCIPPNPVVEALRLRAELNLYKIRTCRNIAGVERPIDPYAAPTDTVSGLPQIGASGQLVLPGTASLLPTPYRYSTLIERAKQLVQIAALVEASMLSAFEKRDAELYNLLRARQDVQLARQGVRLQRLRIREAEHGVDLAELQEERAQLQVDHYAELLEAGLSALEQQALVLMTLSAGLQLNAAMASFLAATLPSGFGQFGIPQYSPQAAAGAVASGLSSLAGMASTTASILSTYASYERRAQEWEFQRQLSQKDVRIAAQQVNLAQDHVRIVGQEHEIAQLQADHAQETLDFLSSKFTNVELYDWMSGVLSGVYGYFLQQATAMARLAEQQLAFERQEVPPAIVQADYWAPPAEGLEPASDGGPDRSGLTGSARLLRDIHQLDQHAFETDKRKLQLTKTISLARLAPIEFERFRSSGVMRFDTPLPLFDRDFPGHYLRLIKRVRTSVVALVPPTEGVRATLSSLGSSRVVIGGDVFQTIVVRRPPESVALSSPRDATGLFELQSPPEMLLPFEGLGVDTSWEFRMPRAANACDYATIADVLLTLEYTALDSFTYREQVVRLLGDTISADRPFSFRHQFADAWYDLNNPSDPAAPRLTASFEMGRRDFPTNLSALRIQQVAVFFAGPDGGPVSAEIRGVELRFTESRTGERRHGAAVDSRGGIVSTRRGGAASWVSAFLDGREPTGTWEIDLPASVLPSLRGEAIQDILFVVTYSAQTPAWSA